MPDIVNLPGATAVPTDTSDPAVLGAAVPPEGDAAAALLNEYHAHVLAQSRVAFWFSLSFASLGFVLIALSVVAAVIDSTRSASVPGVISGTVVEAVAGLFFVQSNRARDLMQSFFEKARADRSLAEALRLAEEGGDPMLRSRVQAVLALRLAHAEASDEIVRAVMAANDAGAGIASASALQHTQ